MSSAGTAGRERTARTAASRAGETAPAGAPARAPGTDPDEVGRLIDRHQGPDGGGLIAALQDIQNRYGYLSAEALKIVAGRTGRPLADIYSVATFYRSFRLTPRGRHLISVCLGTACHVRGGQAVADEFARLLGVTPGSTTVDGEFTFETVNCLGACALGPIVVLDGQYFAKVAPGGVAGILAKAREKPATEADCTDERVFPVDVNCPRCNHSLMDPREPIDGRHSIRITVSFNSHHGRMYLSSLYGSFAVRCEPEIPLDTVLNIFCPHCHAVLVSPLNCLSCGAPMIPMAVRGGGMIQVCARRGCQQHRLDLDAINA